MYLLPGLFMMRPIEGVSSKLRVSVFLVVQRCCFDRCPEEVKTTAVQQWCSLVLDATYKYHSGATIFALVLVSLWLVLATHPVVLGRGEV